jgi:adenine-specific DNA methylase
MKEANGAEHPFVVDPFAGAGSIPLEALRLGCDVFASDLNPVACLILKAKLNDIPLHDEKLRDEMIEATTKLSNSWHAELRDLYPLDADKSEPIAYIWARTVRCEAPNCGAEIPLKGSFWLTRKAKHNRALRYDVERRGTRRRLSFEIFEPKSEKDVPDGTINHGKASCPCCHAVVPSERVRMQLFEQSGGADVIFDEKGKRIGGARLLAVVTVKPGEQGRHYRLSTSDDYDAVWKAQNRLDKFATRILSNGFVPMPDEPMPPIGTLGFRVQRYGIVKWSQLFTRRQLLALSNLVTRVHELPDSSIHELLALTVSKLAERNNVLCNWMMEVECPGHLFTQQVLPPSWDFAEAVPIGGSSGSFDLVVKHTINSALACSVGSGKKGDVYLRDARELHLPDESSNVLFTDPPYYDSIPYSDLSDFFYVWIKRALPKGHPLMRDPFDPTSSLTPKIQELVVDEAKKVDGHPKDKLFWQQGMTKAFVESRRILRPDGVGCVVFAHKTTEGWEALLEAMTKGGWVITGSWPITTERAARVRARDSAALASSIHLVCRPRQQEAGIGDWSNILRELPKSIGSWMERLDKEGIHGADLVFSCIGPALELFSRYEYVETPEGRKVELAEYLEKVWEVVGRTALEQVLGTAEARARNGAAGVLEEDSRLTALFLWTLMSSATDANTDADDHGRHDDSDDDNEDDDEDGKIKKKSGYSLLFDVARRFAQPLGIDLEEWKGRIIEIEKGVVRLIPVKERSEQLFGTKGASDIAHKLERFADKAQMILFPGEQATPAPVKIQGKKQRAGRLQEVEENRREATTLDRVHAAMLLQASGQPAALKALIEAEQKRSPDFIRLANALSALYPKASEEKRLLDAMLLAVTRR